MMQKLYTMNGFMTQIMSAGEKGRPRTNTENRADDEKTEKKDEWHLGKDGSVYTLPGVCYWTKMGYKQVKKQVRSVIDLWHTCAYTHT